MSLAERPVDEWYQPPSETATGTADTSVAAAATPVKTVVAYTTAAVWGWLPLLSVIQAGGLLLVSLANVYAGSLGALSNLLFWLGLIVILAPAAIRLISASAARQERVGLVMTAGLALYLIKLMQSPFAFTYGDEFLHLFNTNQILQTHQLFTPNSVLIISPFFPGLPSITAAITNLTGLSVFQAGAILIGVARLVLVIALFLFTEQVSRSHRVAGLTTLFFMCNSNFLYWSAQFAYESLAFPLVISVLYLVARRDSAGRRTTYMAYSVLAILAIGAVVITHHLSSYFMVAFLFGWWLLVRTQAHFYLHKTLNIVNQWRHGKVDSDQLIETLGAKERAAATADDKMTAAPQERGPEGLALLSFILALAWLTYVAITTYGYLSGIIGRAGVSIFDVLSGSAESRQLFASTDGYDASLVERVVTIAGVVLSLLGLPFGLHQLWRSHRHQPTAWLLAAGSLSYFAVLPLRLTNAAWSTGNRASVYFYLGLAFVLALAAEKLWVERQRLTFGIGLRRLAFATCFMVIFSSGVIAGWNPQIRFTQPLVVDAAGTLVEAHGVSAAQWMKETVGTQHTIVTDEANGRLMLANGEQKGYVGTHIFVYDLLRTPTFSPTQLAAMASWELEYAVVDRRERVWDTMTGYFFERAASQGVPLMKTAEPAVYEKFDRQPLVDRVMDAGDLVIYDVADLTKTAQQLAAGEAVAPEIVKTILAPANSGLEQE